MKGPLLGAILLLVVCCVCAEGGASLRGALEALQRRQRGRFHVPQVLPDYEALYEYLQPQLYSATDNDYGSEIESPEEDPGPKYIVRFLDGQGHPLENYKYKIIDKKEIEPEEPKVKKDKKESAFRERMHQSDNKKLRDLFTDKNEEKIQGKVENDVEYAMLLGELWSKYKSGNPKNGHVEVPSQGVVKLYKDKIVKKRTPYNWGPIAYKKKRSPESNNDNGFHLDDYTGSLPSRPSNDDDTETNMNIPEDDKNDYREEYTIAFEPLDDQNIGDIRNFDAIENQPTYDVMETGFPVSKRSSGPHVLSDNYQKKRYASEYKDNKQKISKSFRSSAGTDPKIIKDLSEIFGDGDEVIKGPVKRSTEDTHESKPPKITGDASHNENNDQNNSKVHELDSHELHGHNMHHPGISGKDQIDHTDPIHMQHDNPIIVKKKSIDWSNYFGIDKRKKKSVDNAMAQDRIRKQYFNTFNKEVILPLNSFKTHSHVKRNYVENKPHVEIATSNSHKMESETGKDNDSKLDNIDKKLKTMESIIVDEALHYSNIGEELDSKEQREVKEKLLNRLAAAYSLEKMRKAMKEFKQSLKIQKNENKLSSSGDMKDENSKRIAAKKEKATLKQNDIPSLIKSVNSEEEKQAEEFEGEQGAGHFLNGRHEEQYSEGYMGGSGRHLTPLVTMVDGDDACPGFGNIVNRCRGVDLLAGDRGQLFLPLCSMHQLCYLCDQSPSTTCDLVFLSEADTACEGDAACQRAARSTLMGLRELHDALADELDGECEANPCLAATLKMNISWQRALQR